MVLKVEAHAEQIYKNSIIHKIKRIKCNIILFLQNSLT